MLSFGPNRLILARSQQFEFKADLSAMAVPVSSTAQQLPPHIEDDFFLLATPLRYMQEPILHLKSDNDESGCNPSYNAPPIEWKDVAV